MSVDEKLTIVRDAVVESAIERDARIKAELLQGVKK
jgi:hypothetical protein